MGGTTLITKGILGPIEGDVIPHEVCLPLDVDREVTEMNTVLPDEVVTLVELPDAVTTDIDLNEMELDIEVPLLNVETELEE